VSVVGQNSWLDIMRALLLQIAIEWVWGIWP
jgi:hypothetical protein